jgi:hypothetical protein
MMAQGKQQNSWDSSKFCVDCVLVNVSRQLEADGCVLECIEDGYKLITPDHLRAGDFVKVQLWLAGEEAFIDIQLAEVRKIHQHWITVDMTRMSPHDRMRLKRFIDAPAAMHIEEPALIDHLLIRT